MAAWATMNMLPMALVPIRWMLAMPTIVNPIPRDHRLGEPAETLDALFVRSPLRRSANPCRMSRRL